jgi:hypothetical protein
VVLRYSPKVQNVPVHVALHVFYDVSLDYFLNWLSFVSRLGNHVRTSAVAVHIPDRITQLLI